METAGAVGEIDVSQEYLKADDRVAETRVIQAGYQLGAVLKRIVAE